MAERLRVRLGFALTVIGFILIVVSAAEYLGKFMGLQLEVDASTFAFGIILVAIGLFQASRKK